MPAAMADSSSTLHDIADPTPHLPGVMLPFWVWIAATVVVLAGVLALLIILLRRPRRPTKPPLDDVYEMSRDQLDALRGELDSLPIAEVATRASLAVRFYLAACLEEPALYETHEEFLLRDDALDKLPAGARGRLNPLLEHLAELKYGPSGEDPNASRALVDKSLEVLQGLESTRPRPVA